MNEPIELVTVTEAAGLLDTSRSQIHRQIELGHLTTYALAADQGPRRTLYLARDEVEALRGTWQKRERR